MAPATGSQRRTSRETAVPRGLERRLFVSYFLVFALLLLGFTLAIHFSFDSSLESQMAARLEILLSVGARSVRIEGGNPVAIKHSLSATALLARGEGLQWFDRSGSLVGSEGLVPAQKRLTTFSEAFYQVSAAQVLRTRTKELIDPRTGAVVGWVRAAQDVGQIRSDAWHLDVILIIGGLFTLAASALGGRYLQVGSVRPIRTSYERLQEFSANASHELRGPITVMNSNADAALRDDAGMRTADRDRFAAISQAAKQMRRLTDDLLLLARADRSIERELFVVDLASLIDTVVRLYRPAFDKQNVLLASRTQSGIRAYGNPDQIERIIGNLLENALRYTPVGGSVEVQASQDRRGVSVRVRDTGIGIDKDQLDRIFDRFWRVQTARHRADGTGLGLPIARALARRHGGDVTVSSRLGHGSEFIVTFPDRPPT